MSTTALRRSVISGVVGGAVAAAALAGASPAQAGAWEQISRSNGGQGAALFSNRSIPVYASNTGKFAIYQQQALLDSYDRSTYAPTKLRNILDNTTRTVGVSVKPVLGFGNAELVQDVTDDEKTLLISGPNPNTSSPYDLYRFSLRPAAGGKDVPISGSGYSDETVESGAISGNGKTVALIGPESLQVVDVATLRTKLYPVGDAFLTISNDGKVIAGTDGCCGSEGFTIVDGVLTQVSSKAKVSADGSTLVLWNQDYAAPATAIEVRKVRTGTSKQFTPPAGVGALIWVSPDGNRLVFAGATPGAEAKSLNVTTGAWTKFGREFSTSIDRFTRISPNGRYAVIEYVRKAVVGPENSLFARYDVSQAALVDLTGQDLPGAQEALSASSYLRVTPPLAGYECESDGVMRASYGRPAPWAPLPRRGELTVTIDGAQAFHRVFRSPTEADVEIPVGKDAKSVTTKVDVTDDQGRKLSTQQTIAVRCYYVAP